ncbi:MAG: hypothetical protein QOJ93_3488 [Actinomycetota bacterium]|nr:hypothetical protein [Actinomycetota bacterium]
MRRRLLPAVMATLLTTAACGSTVQTTADGVTQAGGTGTGANGLGTTDAAGTSAGPGVSGGNRPVGPGRIGTRGAGPAGGLSDGVGNAASSGSGGSSPSGTGTQTGSTSGPRGPVRAAAPGITAKTIYIGVGYSSQTAAGDKALGAGGAAPSYNTPDVVNAALDYANKHGGYAGRQMKAIYYDYDLTADTSGQDQSACARYTQDNKVFAIVAGTDILRRCAEKAGAIGLGGPPETAKTFQRYPHYVDSEGIRLDRLGVVTVNALHTQHYFTGKLGLLTWDDPDYRYTMTQAYLPTLAMHGIKPATDPIYVSVPQSVGALSDTSAAMSAAVQKFKTLGIDHVMIVDGPAGVFSGDGLTLEFMTQAKSQNYYPRYGGNSKNAPGFGINPSDEMDQGLFVDQADYDKSNDVGWHTNKAREECFKLMTDAGYPPQNQSVEAFGGAFCDVAFFLQQVINSLSVLSTNAFMQAVGGLGTSFPSAIVFGTRFAADRHDGGSLVRIVTYLKSCQCLKYLTTPYDAG